MELTGSIAVITGTSRGIGKATAELMLEKGIRVMGWGRTSPPIEHGNFHFIQADIRDEEEVKAAADKTEEMLGIPDLLVNNAGLGVNAPIEEMDPQEWHQMFDTNVHGLFYCIRRLVPGMKKKGEGHIVNVASLAGKNGIGEMAGYCGTKHAVVGISESLFKELRQSGIKVTCILPGSTRTGFFDNIEGNEAHDHMMRPEDVAGSIMDAIDSHPNYLLNELEVRPLQPKG
ncbi:MAG: SDR family oxidoreductase [Flavobacteriales bacterium]